MSGDNVAITTGGLLLAFWAWKPEMLLNTQLRAGWPLQREQSGSPLCIVLRAGWGTLICTLTPLQKESLYASVALVAHVATHHDMLLSYACLF